MAVPYHNAAGGLILMIGGHDAIFHARVSRSLDKIAQTLAGTALLAGIAANRLDGSNTGIVAGPGSQCACVSAMSDVSRARIVQAIFDTPAMFPFELDACMLQLAQQGNYAWMAGEINNSPVYDIVGMPNAAPSNLGVTGQHVDDWVNGVAVYPLPFHAQASQLNRALLTALWPAAINRPGTGGHSRVTWNTASSTIGLTNGTTQGRSKTLGLAHELVHAYYNGRGLQMGLDNPQANAAGVPTVPSAALFEYQCVGLGIWAAEPISENAIRSQWHTVVANTYFGGRASRLYTACAARPCY